MCDINYNKSFCSFIVPSYIIESVTVSYHSINYRNRCSSTSTSQPANSLSARVLPCFYDVYENANLDDLYVTVHLAMICTGFRFDNIKSCSYEGGLGVVVLSLELRVRLRLYQSRARIS